MVVLNMCAYAGVSNAKGSLNYTIFDRADDVKDRFSISIGSLIDFLVSLCQFG